MSEEEKHLDLLSVFHYIVGAMTAFFSSIPLIHFTIGVLMVLGVLGGNNDPPWFVGFFFMMIGGGIVICGWALAVAIIIAGRKLKKRESYNYCFVVAALECIMMPYGTVLGVFTIITLMKDEVKEKFG